MGPRSSIRAIHPALEEYDEMEQPPYGSVLEWEGIRILLDCGMDSNLSEEYSDRLQKVCEGDGIDLVLLSHHEARHVAGLALCDIKAPVYATQPCAKLGRLAMLELWSGLRASHGRASVAQKLNAERINQAFERIRFLKFDQPLEIKNRQGSTTIVTAHRAGYSVGGAWWRIESGGASVCYCVDLNRKTEMHLAGADLHSITETEILITDCEAVSRVSDPIKKNIPKDIFVDRVVKTLRNGGNVLIPVEPTSRGLELALVLNSAWRTLRLAGAYSLIFCHSTIDRVLELSRCQLEWMSSDIQKAFDRGGKDGNWHPLALEHIDIMTSVDALLHHRRHTQKSICVLASSSDLSTGASAALLRTWSADPKNLIVQTSRDALPVTTKKYHGRQGRAVKLNQEARAAFFAAVSAKNAMAKKAKDRKLQAEQLATRLFLTETPLNTNEPEEQAFSSVIDSHTEKQGEEDPADPLQKASTKQQQQQQQHLLEQFATPWHLCFPPPAPQPAIDDYGMELPLSITKALERAKSTLFGLETREGYGYLTAGAGAAGAQYSQPSQQAPQNRIKFNQKQEHKPLNVALPAALLASMQEEKEDQVIVALDYDDEASDTEDPLPLERKSMMTEFEIKAQLIFLPGLDGLCDLQEIKHTLISLRPRALVLLPSKEGQELALTSFAESPAHNWHPQLVAALTQNTAPLNLSLLGASARLEARLDSYILRDLRLKGRPVGDGYTVLRLPDALSLIDDDANKPLLSRSADIKKENEENEPSLEENELAPPEKKRIRLDPTAEVSTDHTKEQEQQPALWVSSNELLLTALKDAVQAGGLQAEIKAGTLVCASNIIVRKKDIPNSKRHLLVIDGPISPAYFTISALLKHQFTLI